MDQLNPDFAAKLQALQSMLADRYGMQTRVISGFRSPEKQAQLYAQGRTAPGPIVTYAQPGSSFHNHGMAVDLHPVSGDTKAYAAAVRRAFAENPGLGLRWGGNFKKLYDPAHIELDAPLPGRGGMPAPAAPQVAGGPPAPPPAAPGTPAAPMPLFGEMPIVPAGALAAQFAMQQNAAAAQQERDRKEADNIRRRAMLVDLYS